MRIVESRIQQLVLKLENLTALAHPFAKGFDQVLHCLSDAEVHAVAQGILSETVSKQKKEDIEGKEGATTVYSTTFYIGFVVKPRLRAYLRTVIQYL